ncbi:MAG: FAD:protein FMN transferase [bacterium]|nr:FAD:protein FMN transferase [bacterium]
MKKILFLLSAYALIINCENPSRLKPIEQTRVLMDTFVQIVVYDQHLPEQQILKIINLCFDQIEQIEAIVSNYNDSSAIAYINRNASRCTVRLDSVLLKVISAGQRISEQTDGAFDLSIAPVKRLWHFSEEQPSPPHPDSIRRVLSRVDYRMISIHQDSIRFLIPGMQLDLGGIAKGFAIDQALLFLQSHGLKDVMVNAGGDLRATVSELTQGKRRIWIRHPRRDGQLFGSFQMDNGSIATSGDYERFFENDSIRYHHILDPKTGFPARQCVSVTIYTSDAMTADALATAVFVLGHEKGLQFVNQLKDTECVIIYDQDGKLAYNVSQGLAASFKIEN